jgi:hypothetical protein
MLRTHKALGSIPRISKKKKKERERKEKKDGCQEMLSSLW